MQKGGMVPFLMMLIPLKYFSVCQKRRNGINCQQENEDFHQHGKEING